MDESKRIPLTKGAFAVVSDEDYESISQHVWHLTSHGYAARAKYGCIIYMHREINRTPHGFHTDHISGNKLDNRRSNLRTATKYENGSNSSKQAETSSQFKGVCFVNGRGANPAKGAKWVAYITHENERTHLGHYATELDAAWAYNLAAEKQFGKFAKLNVLPIDFTTSKPAPTVFIEAGRSSKFRGVSYNRTLKYWTSNLVVGGKKVLCRYHKTETEAALAYNEAAQQHQGERAKLNAV